MTLMICTSTRINVAELKIQFDRLITQALTRGGFSTRDSAAQDPAIMYVSIASFMHPLIRLHDTWSRVALTSYMPHRFFIPSRSQGGAETRIIRSLRIKDTCEMAGRICNTKQRLGTNELKNIVKVTE